MRSTVIEGSAAWRTIARGQQKFPGSWRMSTRRTSQGWGSRTLGPRVSAARPSSPDLPQHTVEIRDVDYPS